MKLILIYSGLEWQSVCDGRLHYRRPNESSEWKYSETCKSLGKHRAKKQLDIKPITEMQDTLIDKKLKEANHD